jgi:hypothetical protein
MYSVVVEFISITKCRRLLLNYVEVSYLSFWFCLRFWLICWGLNFRAIFSEDTARSLEVQSELSVLGDDNRNVYVTAFGVCSTVEYCEALEDVEVGSVLVTGGNGFVGIRCWLCWRRVVRCTENC